MGGRVFFLIVPRVFHPYGVFINKPPWQSLMNSVASSVLCRQDNCSPRCHRCPPTSMSWRENATYTGRIPNVKKKYATEGHLLHRLTMFPVIFTQNKFHVITKSRKSVGQPQKDSGHCLPNYGEWRLKPVTENRGLLEPMVVR